MSWLEVTVTTASTGIDDLAAALTAAGFEDMVIEDQQELEGFLEQNRNYWDYIDEELQQQLQGLSQIRLFFEDTDTQSMTRLKALLEKLKKQMNMLQWLKKYRKCYAKLEPISWIACLLLFALCLLKLASGGFAPFIYSQF